jgi:hypothetical protein
LGDRHPRIGARRGRLRTPALFVCACAIALGACGSSDDRNASCPPVPINVSVQLGARKVTVSPA